MEQLKVTLNITLSRYWIQEELNEGSTQEEILEEIQKHISDAIGHKWHDGWHYIEGCVVTSIGVS